MAQDSTKAQKAAEGVAGGATAGGSVKAEPKTGTASRQSEKDETRLRPAETAARAETAAEADIRPAGPARSRVAANDDLPSIGGLIYALQQRPSRSPFIFAFAGTLVWLVLGGIAAWTMLGAPVGQEQGITGLVSQPASLLAAATVVIPIALFWFLALLVWRAQELRLMASAMTEVAVRLAEPDKMAEQSIASLGQTIRRQVAAMNDAISRALGRAGELEALVHNEVAALERSYSENELRIRGLIEELASERDALANNSERVSETLRGVGNQVSREINLAGEQATRTLSEATSNIADSITAKSGKITAAMTAAGSAIDKKLAEQGARLGEQLIAQGTEVAGKLEKSSKQAAEIVDVKANALFQSLASINDKLAKDVPGLLGRLDTEQKKLDTLIGSASKNFTALETALAKRTDDLKTTLSDKIKALDGAVADRTKAVEDVLGRNTMRLSQVMAEGADTMKKTTEHMAAKSGAASKDLSEQAKMLNEVSRGLLDQVHTLTQRFEKQGQAIMSAAQALDSSNAKIDSILQRRHGEISGLLNTVMSKAQGLDRMMRSYTGIIETSLSQVEERAKQVSASLAQESAIQSRATLAEIERLRSETRSQTEKAVQELHGSLQSITGEVSGQLGTISTQFDRTTRELRQSASVAAGEIEHTRLEMQERMRTLPQEARQSTETMRRAISDQLRALGSISAIATEHGGGDHPAPVAPNYQPNYTGGSAGGGYPAPPAALSYGGQGSPSGQPQGGDLRSVTSNLAQRLSGAAIAQPPAQARPQQQAQASGVRAGWSVGDLLARASQPDHTGYPPSPPMPPRNGGAPGGGDLRLTDLASAIDQHSAADFWRRFRSGEQNILNRQIYNRNGQVTFDQISQRYQRDPDFRTTVNRYIADFERLLTEAESKGQDAGTLQNYLTSETGRVYLMLAHASGRLR